MTTVENALVSVHKGEVITTSRKVAEIFHKQHKHVIRDIEHIISQMASEYESPKVGSQKFFFETTYTVEGNTKSYKEYLMNFDGFSILILLVIATARLSREVDYFGL